MTDDIRTRGLLAGKVVIVTGGASGLGAADSRKLAAEGAIVVLTDVNVELGRTVADQIPDAIFVEHDVRSEASWLSLMHMVKDLYGRLDGLVNNAGVVEYSPIDETTIEQYRHINSIISEGTFLGCKHAITLMRAGSGGSIANISSTAAVRGYASVASYTAAKGAVIALTRSVAIRCKEQGYAIRCNVVIPGAHDTPMTRAAITEGPASEQGFETIRRGLQGKPEDVADLVVFLMSDHSKQINGTSIVIDNAETAG